MIVDVFTFFNEYDLLEYRLEYMYPHVDLFVIVEGKQTFTGQDKPLNFLAHKSRYEKYLDKIRYHAVDLPMTKEELDKHRDQAYCKDDAWVREYAQRTACKDYLSTLGLSDGVVILSSDVDEIPNLKQVLTNFQPACINYLCQHLYCQCIHLVANNTKWKKATALRYSLYKQYHPDHLRNYRDLKHPTNYIEDAGWHLTYFGNAHSMHVKMSSFAHQEESIQRLNKLAHLRECVASHRLLNDNKHYTLLKDDHSDLAGTKPPLLHKYLEAFSYCKHSS